MNSLSIFIAWGGLVGAWLLFLGPIYQAALELRAHEIARDRIESVLLSLERPRRISTWWWLVPPVKLALDRKRKELHKQAFMDALSTEDFASLMSFANKATAWLIVASGGLLLAVNQTYQVAVTHHFGLSAFLVIAAVSGGVSVLVCTMQIVRSETLVARKKASATSAGPSS